MYNHNDIIIIFVMIMYKNEETDDLSLDERKLAAQIWSDLMTGKKANLDQWKLAGENVREAVVKAMIARFDRAYITRKSPDMKNPFN